MPVDPRLESLLIRILHPAQFPGISSAALHELVDLVRDVVAERDKLQEDIAEIKSAYVAFQETYGITLEDADRPGTFGGLRAEIAALREALAEVQWCSDGECPRCRRNPYLGHEPWCVIGKVMGGAS
ncbi:hypothetical protein [Desulfovibrio aminophilus]|uniref:hypothetical protein n=1 Tax=Desulfovibrio aminophilus TaxID=81425 RepID=UPI000400F9DF|nr:hypothetical protein [Desulfovibrio aminophilus]